MTEKQYWLATEDGGYLAGPFPRYQYAYNKRKKIGGKIVDEMPKARAGQEHKLAQRKQEMMSYDDLPKCVKPKGATALVRLKGGPTCHASDDLRLTRCGIGPEHGSFVKFEVTDRGNPCEACGVTEASAK